MEVGGRNVYVDLGAERPFAAEKDGKKIAVEVKSFRSASDLRDYENALGQYIFYRSLLIRSDPTRKLYLAVPNSVYLNTFTELIILPSLEDLQVSIVTFNPTTEEIVKWINWKNTAE